MKKFAVMTSWGKMYVLTSDKIASVPDFIQTMQRLGYVLADNLFLLSGAIVAVEDMDMLNAQAESALIPKEHKQ